MVNYLAQFWGYTFVVIGIILLIRRENIKTLFRIVQNEEMMLLTGYLALIGGIAHILLYNVWSAHWTVIVTLIGWLALVKGIVRLAAPKFAQKMIQSYDKSGTMTVMLVVLILVGIFLLRKSGFGA